MIHYLTIPFLVPFWLAQARLGVPNEMFWRLVRRWRFTHGFSTVGIISTVATRLWKYCFQGCQRCNSIRASIIDGKIEWKEWGKAVSVV